MRVFSSPSPGLISFALLAVACSGKLDVGANGGASAADGGVVTPAPSSVPPGEVPQGPKVAPACNALDDTETVVAAGGGRLVSNGDSLFYVQGLTTPKQELFRVAVGSTGQPPEAIATRAQPFGFGMLSADAARVAYVVTEVVPNEESYTIENRDVVALDLATKTETTLPRPPGDASTIGSVLARDGSVYFSAFHPGGDGVLVRWNGADSTTITSLAYGDPWFVDGTNVYVHEHGVSATPKVTTLKKVPVGGGDAVTLKEFAKPSDSTRVAVVGARDGRVYYRPAAGGIASIGVDGGDERVHVPAGGGATATLVGPEHFFMVPYDPSTGSATAIHRASKAGGAVEVFVQESVNIDSVTIDECNVYWRTGSPAVIKGKRQRP